MQCDDDLSKEPTDDVLEVSGLKFGYSSRIVLESIDFTIRRGDFVALLGPNGSGKTTLMRCINRVVPLNAGTIRIDGLDLSELSRDAVSRLCTTVPADIPTNFSLSTREFVALGRTPYNTGRWWETDEDLDIVDRAMREFDIDRYANKRLHELSSGERARALLAKGVVQRPKLMMVDEPSAHLDIKYRIQVMEMLRGLSRLGITVLMASHDLNLVTRYCDKAMLLSQGHIVEYGDPNSVIKEDSLHRVFDIDVKVLHEDGFTYIIPRPPTDDDRSFDVDLTHRSNQSKRTSNATVRTTTR